MFYCPRCKAEFPAEARFCGKCGYQRKSQQFVGPGFLPSRKQGPDPQHISEQQTQQIPVEVVKGRPQLIDAYDDFKEIEDNFESYAATSHAAEHWRTSWRNRQRSEAGPATSVSRGQSAVPEPLMAMQQSFARMRAIIAPSSRQNKENGSLGFWITIFLMASLIIGMGAFIVSTYLPNPDAALPAGAPGAPIPTDTPQPSLRMEGPQLVSIPQGQMLHLHGENFDTGAPIIFLLDRNRAINGTNGLEISLVTSDEGTFDVVMPTAKWSIGVHLIQAQNNKNGQSAYFYIRISPPIQSIKRSS
jgi:hypothetical protein